MELNEWRKMEPLSSSPILNGRRFTRWRRRRRGAVVLGTGAPLATVLHARALFHVDVVPIEALSRAV